MSRLPDKTPLTEQQARSLAHWWGGKYRQMPSASEEQPLHHGILVTRTGHGRLQAQADTCYIFSLEEAREMENRRGFQEAASPDWVG